MTTTHPLSLEDVDTFLGRLGDGYRSITRHIARMQCYAIALLALEETNGAVAFIGLDQSDQGTDGAHWVSRYFDSGQNEMTVEPNDEGRALDLDDRSMAGWMEFRADDMQGLGCDEYLDVAKIIAALDKEPPLPSFTAPSLLHIQATDPKIQANIGQPNYTLCGLVIDETWEQPPPGTPECEQCKEMDG